MQKEHLGSILFHNHYIPASLFFFSHDALKWARIRASPVQQCERKRQGGGRVSNDNQPRFVCNTEKTWEGAAG